MERCSKCKLSYVGLYPLDIPCEKHKYCAPAQEENEMEPIERLAIAAEKHLAKCEELEPLHTNFLICQMNHIDSLRDPKSRTAELRERWDRAYFAALTGACAKPVHVWPDGSWDHYDPVGTAESVANETIRRHAELMASRDAAIAEVVG